MVRTIHNYLERPHWSYSRLAQFINICQLAYAFKYVYGLVPEHTPVSMIFGRAFHSAATWLAARRRDGKPYTVKDAEDFFSEALHAECKDAEDISFDEDETEDSLDQQGRKMVECLDTSWPQDEKVAETGTVFCVPVVDYTGIAVSDKPICGELDMVTANPGGGNVIVDWKTSARRWPTDKAAKELQATVYLYAFCNERRIAPGDVSFRFDVLTKAKTPTYSQHPTERGHDHFQRLIRLVETVEKAVKAEAFLPSEQGFYCGGCVYAGACREWHRQRTRAVSVAA